MGPLHNTRECLKAKILNFLNNVAKGSISGDFKPGELDPIQFKKVETIPAETMAFSSLATSEINQFSAQIARLWGKYLEFVASHSQEIAIHLKEKHINAKTEVLSSFIKTKEWVVKTFPIEQNEAGAEEQKALISTTRKILYNTFVQGLTLEDLQASVRFEEIPVLFEDMYTLESPSPSKLYKDKEGVHLFIFVHGLMGCSDDMRLMKDILLVRFPNAQFLCSCANEGQTEGDIGQMGINLAKEVKEYIGKYYPDLSSIKKISIICHSMGGVISRTALQYLEEYKDKFYTFLTFSSPHLGCMFQSSKMVEAGMWILTKVKKCLSVEQLGMTDSPNKDEKYMYKVSKAIGLEWFENVVLFSSFQDMYAPFESARIEVIQQMAEDPAKAALYKEMAQNVLSRIKANKLYRINVAYNICLLYTSPSPRDLSTSRMPSSA
eukprot:TRINITY_DN4290_c0_g1_i1.p1 TRINITY_DN4290_c0_g1~~TRINITY_DN4290_c0_g1_i1.p1  ORF type:complete len:436 (+),score=99.16 TRINITY_DN4290_c0_g1_i1:3-1310(+)